MALPERTTRRSLFSTIPPSIWLIMFSFIGLAIVGLQRDRMVLVAPLYMLAFVGMIWTYRLYRDYLTKPGAILFWACVFRLLLLWMGPQQATLSDDYYRYIWDGHLTAQGWNAFEHRPDDAALIDQREAMPFEAFPFEEMNSKDKFSVYPPLSQIAFALPGLALPTLGFAGSFVLLKAIFVLFELTGVAFLLLAAKRGGGVVGKSDGASDRIARVALYAWNPLPIIAFAGIGHSEAGLVLGIGIAVWAVQVGRIAVSWLGLALAGLSKLVPFVAVPLWYKRFGWRGAWLGVLVCLATTAFFWFPSLPVNYFQSLRLYVQGFEFNAPIYGFLLGVGAKKLTWTWFCADGCNIIGPMLAIVFLVFAARVFLRRRMDSTATLWRAVMMLISAYLLLATTVHPWYGLWALVLIPVTPLLRNSWLWFSFASVLTYFSYLPDGSISNLIHPVTSAVVWLGFAWFAWQEFRADWVPRILRNRAVKKAEQIQPFVAGNTVLDLGCGEGYVGEALAREGYRVTLCDVAMMNQMNQMNRTSLPFHSYDGETLPFEDDTFDTVALSLVLHHCANPERVIAEAARVARRRLVITESTWENKLDFVLINFLDRRANRLRGGALREQEEHLEFRSVPQWHATFESAGLRATETVWLNRLVHKHVLFALEPADAID